MKQHEEWFSKAEGDLKSSKTLYATGDETFESLLDFVIKVNPYGTIFRSVEFRKN